MLALHGYLDFQITFDDLPDSILNNIRNADESENEDNVGDFVFNGKNQKAYTCIEDILFIMLEKQPINNSEV